MALSWRHGEYNNRFADVELQNGQSLPGAVIAFSNKVLADRIDAQHIYQMLLTHSVALDDRYPLLCRCAVPGVVLPVEVLDRDADGTIVKVRQVASPSEAVAFIADVKYLEYVLSAREHWMVLRGDFVLDEKGRAVDAEFVRGELPSGDRPAGSDHGIQGGLFESWFSVLDEPGEKVAVNAGSFAELKALPRIGDVLAERIIAGRPYRKAEDLLQVHGVTESVLAEIRDLIRFD